jgi:fatty-acyl-CoA synthase
MRDTMRELFDHAIAANRERIAVEYGDDRYRYDEIGRWSTAVAHQLRALGVGPGDAVAMYLRNRPEFLVTDVAVNRIGAIKAPVNYMLARDSVEYILGAAAPKVLVVDPTLVAAAEEALAGSAARPAILVVPAPGADVPEGAAWLAGPPSEEPEPLDYAALPVQPDSPNALYFTGGTTGKPKGVLHTQASTASLHYAQLLEAEIAQSERMLLMTPMAHAAGLFAQAGFVRGATLVIRDGFDAEDTVDLLVTRGITWTFLVPTMIYRILDILEASGGVRDLALRTIVYGAAPISSRRLEQALAVFGSVFVQLYGQTESPNWGTRLTKLDHDPARPELLGSCGRASIMVDVKVVGEDGVEALEGETGEICLRSPYLLREYLHDETATAEKFLDGFIRTGDLGFMQDGYLYLRDRKNDMVISGGMNVYSKEVEDALGRHPGVKQVAVIGVPHEDWGEAVHAIVVRGDAAVDEAELLAFAKQHLSAYARPKTIEFVDALPETAFGKVDKKILRAPYWADQSRSIG